MKRAMLLIVKDKGESVFDAWFEEEVKTVWVEDDTTLWAVLTNGHTYKVTDEIDKYDWMVTV